MTGRHKLLLAASGMALAFLTGCNQSGRPLSDGTAGPAFAGEAPKLGVVDGSSYIVAPGDTVGAIADRTNTPVRSLIDLNHLVPPYRLQSGTRLLLQPRSNYVVRQGDTIEKIAQSQGVSQSALIQLNNLTAPYAVHAGQSLVLPSGVETSKAPTNVALGQTFVMPQATPDGSTAPTTAPSGGVSKSALPPISSAPAATATNAPKTLSGQPATTTGATTTATTGSATTSAAKPIETQPMTSAKNAASDAALPPPPDPVLPDPDPFDEVPAKTAATTGAAKATGTAAQSTTAQATATQQAAKTPDTVAPPANTGNGQFGWPVQGKVVSKFGATSDGLRNDGINISAPAGAPVQAAADGIVAYAGNELRGFGNMVLIRHANGWVTAYAHNQSLNVKKGDQVKRGQVIARVGSTGNVPSPQVHFEIRKGTSAVDPMKYLGS
jgi:murein DD-endopeptidase MepM/ murein hydrolase activator NlpD